MKSQVAIRPRWSMVLSHHPPSQYDRTLHIGCIRVCARCTGLLWGVIFGITIVSCLPGFKTPSFITLFVIATFVLGLGITAFVLNEIGKRASNNYERLLFGLLLGCVIYFTWLSGVWPFIGLLVLIVVGQFISALLLRKLGSLDKFLNEYLEGAMVDSSYSGEKQACCRHFCSCGKSTTQLPSD